MSRENLKSKRPNKKLNFKRLSTFKIKKQLRLVTFKLKLSKNIILVYPVFYIILLKPALENTPLAKIINIKGYENQDYKIKRILARNKINRINY